MDPDQDRSYVGSDLDKKTVCKDYQQMTKVTILVIHILALLFQTISPGFKLDPDSMEK